MSMMRVRDWNRVDPADPAFRSVVFRIRRRFESGKIPPLVLASAYSGYNPIDDVTRFVSLANELFPRLNCGVASSYLRDTLGGGEVVTGTYNGSTHTFLLFNGTTVVDITADQFGGPRVYIGPLTEPWRLPPSSQA